MKTSDFRINISSDQLNESLQKKFGEKVDIQNFSDQELIRASKLIENKITTFKMANFNSALESEEFFKLKLMKDVIDKRMQEVFGEAKETKMTRAGKGVMKYGKEGMRALAKAGKEGKSLDTVRKKYDKYDEGKGSKPDFLDLDKDGNKKEPMKKAANNKGGSKDKKGMSAKQQKFFGKKKMNESVVGEGIWGGLLGGGLGAMMGGWPGGIGGYLLGSKVGDDLGENTDMGTRSLHHAIHYRTKHHGGDLEAAHHHKSSCSECGGQVWHGDMGECWHSHPMLEGGEPHCIDEGIGKYILPAAGLAGAGYLYNNPAAMAALKGHASQIAGSGLQGAGAGAMNVGNALRSDTPGMMDTIGNALQGAGQLGIDAGNALMESDNSMCELAQHHAVEYRKNHKLGNLKHCDHHKTNVESCGGKLWHDGTGEVFFSHHGHKNGVPEIVKEYTIGGDHNVEGLGKLGSQLAGGYYGGQLGGMAGDVLGGAVGFPGAGHLIGQIGGGIAGGGLAGHGFDKVNKAHFNIEEETEDDTTEGKKMSPKDKKLAAKYPPKDKITRGDVITAAKQKKKTTEHYDRMLKESIRFYLREGEEGKAEVIMAVKDMVDKFTGWSEDIAQMQANTAMEMADSIRDELGSDVSAQFTQAAGPALDSAFQAVKAAREALNGIVGIITGEGGGAMGGMPGALPSMGGAPGGMPGAAPMGAAPGGMPPLDTGADEEEEAPSAAGRAKRESVDRTRRIARLLVGR
jgi:hypothetical protein